MDGLGRRVGKKVNGTLVKQWVWRGQLQPVAELNGSGTVLARYVYAGGINVPALIVASGATYRVVVDHLGSVRMVVNTSTGTIVERVDYDTWGRILADTTPSMQPFRFAGGMFDADTGLHRFGARDYTSQEGRWMAKDPFRFNQSGGPNLFAYSRLDPVNVRDPFGTDPTLGEEGGTPGLAGPNFDDTSLDPENTNSLVQDAVAAAIGAALAAVAAPSGCGPQREECSVGDARNSRCEEQKKLCEGSCDNRRSAQRSLKDCLACCDGFADECRRCDPDVRRADRCN